MRTGGETKRKASLPETLGAWLKVWTPPRDVEVPPPPAGRTLAIAGVVALVVLAGAAALIVPAIDSSKERAAAADVGWAGAEHPGGGVGARADHDQRRAGDPTGPGQGGCRGGGARPRTADAVTYFAAVPELLSSVPDDALSIVVKPADGSSGTRPVISCPRPGSWPARAAERGMKGRCWPRNMSRIRAGRSRCTASRASCTRP